MVKAILLTKSFTPKTHSGTLAKFSELFIKSNILSIELGKDLKNAFEMRNQGDYEFSINFSKQDVENFVNGPDFFYPEFGCDLLNLFPADIGKRPAY